MVKKFTFAVVLLLTFASTTAFASFDDVTDETDYADSIQWTVDSGITEGYGDGNWGPDNCVTRAELLKMMIEFEFQAVGGFDAYTDTLMGEPGFSDVNEDDWFYYYVLYSKNSDIIEGYSDGTFKPNQCVNRVESMKIAVESMVPNADLDSAVAPLYYDDKHIADMEPAAWYAEYARFLFKDRLVGTEHTELITDDWTPGVVTTIRFFPAGDITRKEVAYMMHQIALEYPALGD